MKKYFIYLLFYFFAFSSYGQKKANNGTLNGYEWVDLGLPSGTLWATCNVGATSPEMYGDYYAWGETEQKNIYSEETYIYTIYHMAVVDDEGFEHPGYYEYTDLGENISGTMYDVAHIKWGDKWVMPTSAQILELKFECNWEAVYLKGVYGYKVSSKEEGNTGSIFIPAAGYYGYDNLYQNGFYGRYWVSVPYKRSDGELQYYFEFNSSYIVDWGGFRCYGMTVRPVTTKDKIGGTSIENNIVSPTKSQPISIEGKKISGTPTGIYIQDGKKKILK